ncbi:MAG: methylenetetrahydrofolate--tRNA-(uracil(54)-C(5))-methyltransferase (FADH(2)-oxidizing) TrmFO [Candidatus Coatesbacteria bacterium]|nr:MAG: methylenetetrahydrofolate--tRNA-(uracil(54)-C(5))-methyltransferase (FADH(2)-oxidizing) TrmFO [Candidatus Coatesbacteria bacterium]RLC44055.1 MAG: methylenetetrahydrofolate--tRNA-(uracil(54)-C(5))-methyltransferase (FADH(2)-oxidizing) TrmFO [Candidatus Coatesbacteria bacterium]
MASDEVYIAGGGLAGCEASWQLAKRGIKVKLYEMRPEMMTPAHTTGDLAELVCSNSLKSRDQTTAPGMLKAELNALGSLLISIAGKSSIPAGTALAVDRKRFSRIVTREISENRNIKVVREEFTDIDSHRPIIIASGPLTSERLSTQLRDLLGSKHLYFYDAISPTVTAESIDMKKVFKASRYDKGEGYYINCPLNKEEYDNFYNALLRSHPFPKWEFEDDKFFEGCLPIEELAARGEDALRFGPMKPVGLKDPRTGKMPYAVVQLRPEDKRGKLYNMVGFQTRLNHREQEEVFRLIPALREAEFVRLGSSHRNTYINSPRHLDRTLLVKGTDGIYIAGQLVGVEGYVESIAMGLVAGLSVWAAISGKEPPYFPPTTAIGALLRYITTVPDGSFQPMNINFGLIDSIKGRYKSKKEKRLAYYRRSIKEIEVIARAIEIKRKTKSSKGNRD